MFEGSWSLSVCTIDLSIYAHIKKNNLTLINVDTAARKFFTTEVSCFQGVYRKSYFRKKTIIDIWRGPKYGSEKTGIFWDNRLPLERLLAVLVAERN